MLKSRLIHCFMWPKIGEDVSMIDIQELVNEIRRKFYVDACVVLDKCYPKKKKEICKDNVIESVYYERDKNYAHKDTDYKRKQYGSILEMAGENETTACSSTRTLLFIFAGGTYVRLFNI